MSDYPESIPSRSPWRQAGREARAIIIAVLVIGTSYVLFASNAPKEPFGFKKRQKDSALGLVNSTAQTDTAPTEVVVPHDTVPLPLDTAAHPTVDTATTALNEQRKKDLEKARKDSIDAARKLAQQERDNAAMLAQQNQRAEQERFLAQVAGAKEINTDVAKKLFDMKGARFVDARPEHQFEEGYIPGAINVYADQWQPHIQQLIELGLETQIVVYCGGGECELSHDLADKMRSLGFKKVVVYTGGTTEWNAQKYPFTK